MTNDQAQQLINLKVMEEAKKESERRLKIQKVNTTIVEERKKVYIVL